MQGKVGPACRCRALHMLLVPPPTQGFAPPIHSLVALDPSWFFSTPVIFTLLLVVL